MASDPIGKMLAQLDRDILARGTDRGTVCDKAGLNRGAITGWHLVHKRQPTLRGWRSSSWAKIQKVLAEMPVVNPVVLEPAKPEVQPADVAANHTFDDTGGAVPLPTIKDRIEKLEQMLVTGDAAYKLQPEQAGMYATVPAKLNLPVQAHVRGHGDDALRDVILDKLLAMDTVKLADLYAYIVNNLKA